MLNPADSNKLEILQESWSLVCAIKGDEGLIFKYDLNNKIETLKNSNTAYILEDSNGEILALLDIISTNTWLKIFDMTLSPKCIFEEYKEIEVVDTLKSIFIESIDTLLANQDDIKEIKIRARTHISAKLFMDIANNINLKNKLSKFGVTIGYSNHWLFIRKS